MGFYVLLKVINLWCLLGVVSNDRNCGYLWLIIAAVCESYVLGLAYSILNIDCYSIGFFFASYSYSKDGLIISFKIWESGTIICSNEIIRNIVTRDI